MKKAYSPIDKRKTKITTCGNCILFVQKSKRNTGSYGTCKVNKTTHTKLDVCNTVIKPIKIDEILRNYKKVPYLIKVGEYTRERVLKELKTNGFEWEVKLQDYEKDEKYNYLCVVLKNKKLRYLHSDNNIKSLWNEIVKQGRIGTDTRFLNKVKIIIP